MPRTALTLADTATIADIAAEARDAAAVFDAVAALAQRAIGHRLFTIMRLHAGTQDVERLYSSLPDAYKVSGRKPKQGTPWGEQVLDRGEIFVANTPAEIERAFSDFPLILSLGIGAIMNVPIRFRGASLGTMNLCHEAGWFTQDDRDPGRLIAALLVPPLLAG